MMLKKIENFVLNSRHHNRAFGVDITWNSDQKVIKPLAIFMHGYKGFKNWGAFDLMAESFAHAGLPFLKFNFSHNGTSTELPMEFSDLEAFGANTLSIELDDLETVLHAVESDVFSGFDNIVARQEFFLIGFSRAGANAIIQASRDSRIKKLVTWNAVPDFAWRWQNKQEMKDWKEKGVRFEKNTRTGQVMPLYYSIVQDYFDNISSYEVLRQAQLVYQPWLVVHARDDEAVPFKSGLILSELNSNAVFYPVENSWHTFGTSHPHTEVELPTAFQQVVDQTILFLNS